MPHFSPATRRDRPPFTRYGLRLAGERHRIDARNLSREEARKLGVAKGAAALVVAGAAQFKRKDEGSNESGTH